jgi:hypothetical protein
MRKAKNNPEDLTTLMSCIQKARKDGFKDDFRVENKKLATPSGHHYKSHEVSITNFYRFEGASDPADNAILYLVTTNTGEKGILIDAYGIYANAEVSDFLQSVRQIEKIAYPRRNNRIPEELPYLIAILIPVLLILSFVTGPQDMVFNPVITTAAITVAAVYTFWIIVEIINSRQLSSSQRALWLTITIIIPFFGAFIYQALQNKKAKSWNVSIP